jgi:hypothetical protein
MDGVLWLRPALTRQAGKAAAVPLLPRVAGETKAGFELRVSAAGAAEEGALAWDYIRRIKGGAGGMAESSSVGT